MSTALAIAGVTQLLRDVLNDGLVDNDVAAAIGTNVTVHARAPDRVLDIANGSSVLNIFLYRVDNQSNWSNQILPTRAQNGQVVNNTPLTLDLYYLISAVATEDIHADILLGYAMQLLHEHPGFDRAEIIAGLSPAPPIAGGLPPVLQALAQTGLADQVEQLTIVPVYLSTDEMSKLWTTFQATYRPSMAYRVSSVIIEAETPARSPLPVLTIGADNRGPVIRPSLDVGLPRVTALTLPQRQPSARPGDTIVLHGLRLAGADVTVHFESRLLPAEIDLAPAAGGTNIAQPVQLPDPPVGWAAGLYHVTLSARSAPGEPLFRSNATPLQIAPVPDLPAAAVVRFGPDNAVQVTLSMAPDIYPGQRVELIIGSDVAVAPGRAAPVSNAVFTFPDIPAGSYPVRLRVDGVESWLVMREVAPAGPDFLPEPPIFDPAQSLLVPA